MGIFDFMKKKDPFADLSIPDEPNPFGNDINQTAQDAHFTPPQFGQEQNFSPPEQSFQGFEQPGYAPIGAQQPVEQKQETYSKSTREHELELINSKLDTIRALLDGLGQRISSLETRFSMDSERRRKSW